MPEFQVPAVGTPAPDFQLKGPGGATYTLSEHRGEAAVLLVFFPTAFSEVCSHQLPEIQAALPRLAAAGCVVYGISTDSHYANAEFARQLQLGFPLLGDRTRVASAAYGVLLPDAGIAWRASFLVDRDGRIAWSDVTDDPGSLDALPSLADALAVLESMARA
jgi:peroxiredoxin